MRQTSIGPSCRSSGEHLAGEAKARRARQAAVPGAMAGIALALLTGTVQAGLLDKLLGRDEPSEPLPPARAFHVKVEAVGPNAVLATLTPAPEHYLYRNTVRFALKSAKGARLGAVVLPSGVKKRDPFFGETQVYTHSVQVNLPLERPASGPVSFSVVVFYQGCNSRLGVCYPPAQNEFPIRLP
ncbi:protein-disulfide reductase DsbD N-terminal domain-containing protein [Cupriavidus sp. AU9028]|uniref:protein-disulfide reductase DsbD N-terminal domain-containing protein n=1 Tax=Cupriavidus sp. AU9028 TaxID=2871157 RepID=UPI001C9693FE|nr:protein-disulfide reductase DsbD N-terminal domain-containing protein [Cupriavidus sp. AU9028]MBY4899250.1 protein-disulfide reductase DsbD N-terminal domain-containing protein [Cupriavidus sp. AU9028]